jgi:23S rRNA pseudouridine2605 synthase
MVKADGVLDEKQLKRIRAGFRIEDTRVKPISVEEVSKSEGKTWYRVTLVEVQNRLIRKIFENVGHPVDKVRRDSFGPLSLKGLERGEHRLLTSREVESLKELVGLE